MTASKDPSPPAMGAFQAPLAVARAPLAWALGLFPRHLGRTLFWYPVPDRASNMVSGGCNPTDLLWNHLLDLPSISREIPFDPTARHPAWPGTRHLGWSGLLSIDGGYGKGCFEFLGL